MSKINTKIEYIAVALEDRKISAWYGDYIIKEGTEKLLTKKQAKNVKESGVAYFPACASNIYTGYYQVPCKVIKRTTITTTKVVDENY